MLVLSRKAGDEIVIDRDIRIAVLATSGRTVRLGVIAPTEVRVMRSELHDRLPAEEIAAAQTRSRRDPSGQVTIMAGVVRVAR